MSVLFVCTGNLCRSPLAEGLLRVWARNGELEVRSAGVEARNGEPMDPASAHALRELGGDPAPLRSGRLTPTDALGADLVLTMNRWHRAQVLAIAPRAMRRTFTLGEAAELVAIADLTGVALLPSSERAAELARRLLAARSRRPDTGAADVPDPIRGTLEQHREMAAQVAQLLRPLADVLLGEVRTPPLPRRPAPAGQ